MAARSDSLDDAAAFGRITRELEEWVLAQASGGVASWIIYGFERAGLLYHGWNVFDLAITDKGRRWLAALDRFPHPQPRMGPVEEGGDALPELSEEELRDRERRLRPFRFEHD